MSPFMQLTSDKFMKRISIISIFEAMNIAVIIVLTFFFDSEIISRFSH